jgi:hypothetical protein
MFAEENSIRSRDTRHVWCRGEGGECKEGASSSEVVIRVADWGTKGLEAVKSGGRKLKQAGDAKTSSLALEDEAAGLLGILHAASEGWDSHVRDSGYHP